MEAKVCTQCGAPLRGNKCAYCGTEFVSPTHIHKHFHFGEPITVEQEPERIIPVSEPDVLTETDVSMIKKENGTTAEGFGAFAIIGLFVGFIACICAACV